MGDTVAILWFYHSLFISWYVHSLRLCELCIRVSHCLCIKLYILYSTFTILTSKCLHVCHVLNYCMLWLPLLHPGRPFFVS